MPRKAFAGLFGLSEEQAMLRVQAHADTRAFALLVERWEEPIRRLCTRMTGDAHRGEDLAQETFARLFDKRESYRPTGRFSAYVRRLALNLCYDELRKLKRDSNGRPGRDLTDGDTAELQGTTPEAASVRQEEADAVRQALAKLPEIYRTVVIMRHYENLKIREIGETLDIPEGTVKSRLAEALVRLTRLLEPHSDGRAARAIPKRKSKG